MEPGIPLAPHRNVVELACSPAHAFEVFTTGMGTWWDPDYTPDAATFSGIDVEPRTGGAVAMLHGDDRHVFGEVTDWEPGVHYAQTFTLAMGPAAPSVLSAIFNPGVDGGSHVVVEHGGWTRANAHLREKFGDWPHLLAGYRDAAEA